MEKKGACGFFASVGFLVLSVSVLFSCGGGFNEIREEAQKREISPEEKVSLAKDYLDIGLVSEARELFEKAEGELSPQGCKKGETGFNECPYCDALYGKFIAEFIGTLKLAGELAGMLSRSGEGKVSEKSADDEPADLGKTVEAVIGLFLKRVNGMRSDLARVIEMDCAMQSGVTAALNLLGREIVFPAKKSKEDTKFNFTPVFARFNWAVLSLVAGVLDIAYSQNYSISITHAFGFMQDVLKAKSREEALLLLGDFFAQNPALLTLSEKRKEFWQRSAVDFSSALTGVNSFIKSFCEPKAGKDVTAVFLNSIIKSFGINLPLDMRSILCDILSDSLPPLLEKWAGGILGKRKCEVIGGQGPTKIKKDYDFNTDGCIRLTGDVVKVFSLIENFLPPLEVTISPQEFFGKPKALRSFLPLLRKKGEGFIFGIEFEEGADSEHFGGVLLSLAGGYPSPLSEDAVKIPADCVSPKSGETFIYIPFADPTFGGSLFISTEKISKGDQCYDMEKKMGIADEKFLVMPDLRSGNYALNKIIAKISDLAGGLF